MKTINIKRFLKSSLPYIDIYTRLSVPRQCFSIEHVVPQSILKKDLPPKALLYPENLHCCNIALNKRRQNYMFVSSWRGLDDADYGIDSKMKVFAPPRQSRGTIARTILKMLEVYPALLLSIDEIIDPDALKQWKILPITDYDIDREKILSSLYKRNGVYYPIRSPATPIATQEWDDLYI
jgi:hypothetical protein